MYRFGMTISVTELKAHLLEVLRQIEEDGVPVEIVRRGKPVAVLHPAESRPADAPWLRLRGTGTLLAAASESVISDDDFAAPT